MTDSATGRPAAPARDTTNSWFEAVQDSIASISELRRQLNYSTRRIAPHSTIIGGPPEQRAENVQMAALSAAESELERLGVRALHDPIGKTIRAAEVEPAGLSQSLIEYALAFRFDDFLEEIAKRERAGQMDSERAALLLTEVKELRLAVEPTASEVEEAGPADSIPAVPPAEIGREDGVAASSKTLETSGRPSLEDIEPLIGAAIHNGWVSGKDPAKITRDDIAEAVGCAAGTVSKSKPWQMFAIMKAALNKHGIDGRALKLKPHVLKKALESGEMTQEEALNALIADQAADMQGDARGYRFDEDEG